MQPLVHRKPRRMRSARLTQIETAVHVRTLCELVSWALCICARSVQQQRHRQQASLQKRHPKVSEQCLALIVPGQLRQVGHA